MKSPEFSTWSSTSAVTKGGSFLAPDSTSASLRTAAFVAGVLPGLTGYWQVSGKNKLTFEQMISLDLQYIARMNFWLDVAIMLATVPAMLLQYAESRATLKSVK